MFSLNLEGGIDGLVHLSDISWDESEESVRSLNKGDVIDALVLSIESERERISLGMKQLNLIPLEIMLKQIAKVQE